MKYLYSILLIALFLSVLGCSGGQEGNFGPTNTTAIETCYDVQISIAGNSQTKNLCTTIENGGFNGLGTARFIKTSLLNPAAVSVQVTRTDGLNPSDPDIVVYKNGIIIKQADGTGSNTESLSVNLGAGNYVFEIKEFKYSSDDGKVQLTQPVFQKTTAAIITTQALNALVTGCLVGDVCSRVSGYVSFERVNHAGSFLNYSDISKLPIQQALVQAICSSDNFFTTVIYNSESSDSSGNYSLNFPANQSCRVRVKAQMFSDGRWDMSVVDNTVLSKPVYAMDSSTLTAGVDQTLNLEAGAGWGGTGYIEGQRIAAPFAILDSVRKAKDKVLSAANVRFPLLKINWSVDNSTLSLLGTFYDPQLKEIFLMGKENNDTDEYDEHVIIHEWGHYFEDNFSRSDSKGGSHGLGDILDVRLAFGEGFGNAFSAIVTDDNFYIDTSGFLQGRGFILDMENNNCENAGWYSECSVQSMLYDIYDANNENQDSLNMNFSSIYDVLVNGQKNTEAMTSIFSFMHLFKVQNPSTANAVDNLLSGQNIDPVSDVYGSTQSTLNPGQTNQLPVYQVY